MSEARVFELDPADLAPDGHDDASPLRCQWDGCQNTVTKPARGRTPKFCDEHRNVPKEKRAGSRWAYADKCEEVLTQYLSYISLGVTLVNPVDGKIIAEGAPAVAHELVELGRQDKQWRQYLERITKPGKYGGLTVAVAMIVIPVMANHKLLPQFVIPLTEKGGS